MLRGENNRTPTQDTMEIHFRIKFSTSMVKLKQSYADRAGVPVAMLRFIFDGLRVNNEDTPASLGMFYDDVIEVYQEQLGG